VGIPGNIVWHPVRRYFVVPEKLRLPAAVGLGRRICVVKIARKEIFLDQNLAI